MQLQIGQSVIIALPGWPTWVASKQVPTLL
jgi:hypothetical protein